jgi:hypothetical protein
VAESEGTYLAAIPIAVVGRTVRDGGEAKLGYPLAKRKLGYPLAKRKDGLEEQVEPAGLVVGPGEERHRAREAVEAPAAPKVAPAALPLYEPGLRGGPVEVEWAPDDAGPSRQAAESAVELPELPRKQAKTVPKAERARNAPARLLEARVAASW